MHRSRSLLFIILALFLFSCRGQKTVVKKYYVLENSNITSVRSVDSVPLIQAYCHFTDVDVYPAYATRQIANRNRSNEIQYYQNHEWAVRPQIFLNNMVRDYLENSNIFAGVASRYWQVDPQYVFETRVYNLEVQQHSSDLLAHVHLEMILTERATKKTIVRHVADIKQPLENKDLNLAASAISQIFVQELEQVTQKIKATIVE